MSCNAIFPAHFRPLEKQCPDRTRRPKSHNSSIVCSITITFIFMVHCGFLFLNWFIKFSEFVISSTFWNKQKISAKIKQRIDFKLLESMR